MMPRWNEGWREGHDLSLRGSVPLRVIFPPNGSEYRGRQVIHQGERKVFLSEEDAFSLNAILISKSVQNLLLSKRMHLYFSKTQTDRPIIKEKRVNLGARKETAFFFKR